MMRRLWGRIKCLFGRHARGRRVSFNPLTFRATYECSRKCGASWVRQIKQKVEVFSGIEAGPLPQKALDIIEARIKAARTMKQPKPKP